MTEAGSDKLRRLRAEDIPPAAQLSAQAGWNQTEEDWRTLLDLSPGAVEATTYGGMMKEMARALGRRPPVQIPVPLLTPQLSSLWIGLVALDRG